MVPSTALSTDLDLALEAGAYEALWQKDKMTTKKMADLFRLRAIRPSSLVSASLAAENAERVLERLRAASFHQSGIRLNHTADYPGRLRDAEHPSELLYYAGDWTLTACPASVSIVGTRKPSEEGLKRARTVSAGLAGQGFCIISGLAAGVDRAAHEAAVRAGGKTIAVIGTPLDRSYPKENSELQSLIAEKFLLISQVPFLRYEAEPFSAHRYWFPERNVTMAALSAATVIVEAGETSGTLTQARATLKQKRKLFIMASNFDRPGLTWPARFEAQGAMRVHNLEELLGYLS